MLFWNSLLSRRQTEKCISQFLIRRPLGVGVLWTQDGEDEMLCTPLRLPGPLTSEFPLGVKGCLGKRDI